MNKGAGKRSTRVTFQRRTPDSNGDLTGAWVDQFTVMAAVDARNYTKTAEEVLSERLAGRQPIDIVVRGTSQTRRITNAWRVRETNLPTKVYAVRSVAQGLPKDDIIILAEAGIEGAGDG